MSQININVDTEKGTLEMSVDGEKFPNVQDINIFKSEYFDVDANPKNRVYMDVRIASEKVGDGVRKHVTLSTAGSKFAKANQANKIDTFKDFEVFKDSDENLLEHSAASLLGRKLL